LKQVSLGSQGLSVSRMGLGCMGMSSAYGDAEDATSTATIERALELGVSLLDTADMYGWGHNEELVGRAIRSKRSQVQLATKFGNVVDDSGKRGIDGSPAHARAACDRSLQRLAVDEIDLYYLHRVDDKVPIEETVGAMADLVTDGKVRFLGLSEAGAATIRRAQAVHPISALQTEYSMWTRDVEKEVLATCRELGVGFVAYSPLGRGFLTGAITSTDTLDKSDWRRGHPRFQEANFDHNRRVVERLEEIATSKGITAPQLALAWVMAQGSDVVPIPGTRTTRHLETNVAAVDVELTEEDLARIDEVAPPGAASGERYSDMTLVNR